VGERDAAADQAVEVRREDLVVAQGADGLEGLVVGEDEQEVRPVLGLAGMQEAWSGQRGGAGSEGSQKRASIHRGPFRGRRLRSRARVLGRVQV